MTEVFLSPFLSDNDKSHASSLIQDIFPDAFFAEKLTPNVTIRIVAPKDIFFTTKIDCLTMTILCLKQIIEKNIQISDLRSDWLIYCNLFLYKKKISFYKLDEKFSKRYSTMIKCMGGTVVSNDNPNNVDYVITKEHDLINSPLGILPSWIETLFYESQYVKPVHFYVSKAKSNSNQSSQENKKQHHLKHKRITRSSTLKSRKTALRPPVNEMKSIRDDNAGFILRRRDNSQDIRSFLNIPLDQFPSNNSEDDDNDEDENSSNASSKEQAKIITDSLNNSPQISNSPQINITPIRVMPNSPTLISPIKILPSTPDKMSEPEKDDDDDDDVIIISKEHFNSGAKVNQCNSINESKFVSKNHQTFSMNKRIPLKDKTNSNIILDEFELISKDPIHSNKKLKTEAKQVKKFSFLSSSSSLDEEDLKMIEQTLDSHEQIAKRNETNLNNAIQNIFLFSKSIEKPNLENKSNDYDFDSNLSSFSQTTQVNQDNDAPFIRYDQPDGITEEEFHGNDPFLSILSDY